MKTPRGIVNVDRLRTRETAYRRRLAEDPCDLGARTSLAWCLLLLGTYQAGVEGALATLAAEPDRRAAEEVLRDQGLLDREAEGLIQECLRQTFAASRLCTDPHEQREARRLERLVRLCAGEAPLSEAEERAVRLADELLTDLRRAGSPHAEERRRRSRRPV